jgi:hypothetical protein
VVWALGNHSLLKFLLRTEVSVECSMRQAGCLHHFGYGHIVKSPFFRFGPSPGLKKSSRRSMAFSSFLLQLMPGLPRC